MISIVMMHLTVQRLHNLFLQSPLDYAYLQDMVVLDAQRQLNRAHDPLLWLKRCSGTLWTMFDYLCFEYNVIGL